jgi:hypothetical protein
MTWLRTWLKANNYGDVSDLIDEVRAELKAEGSKERRNWYDTLSGGRDGVPLMVRGREFPVLRSFQIRQGKPVTSNAICRNENEHPPDVVATKRWKRSKLPSKAKRPTAKASRSASDEKRAV